jgi:gamma-glutamyl phosphate reductase
MDKAIRRIHEHGSGDTEGLMCPDDRTVGEEFLSKVDASFVLTNTST